jgi:antitoxin StbD
VLFAQTCLLTYKLVMLNPILADASISVSELKKNPSAAIDAAAGFPVAILNRNVPSAYLVPAAAWEALMDRLEDIELAQIVREREGEKGIPVRLEDL